MTEKQLPAELKFDGFVSQVCDAPSMPGAVRDPVAVGVEIKAEKREAVRLRDHHSDEARKAAEAEARVLAGEFVRGNFAEAGAHGATVAEHRAKADEAQRRIDGLNAAEPLIVAEIRAAVTEHKALWRRDAVAHAEAAIVDMTAALSMAREAYEATRQSLGSLSALDDFDGNQEGAFRTGHVVGNLRVHNRPNGWMTKLEAAIPLLEEAVALATDELRDRIASEALRRKAEVPAGPLKAAPKRKKAKSEAPVGAEPVPATDDVPTFEIGEDDD